MAEELRKVASIDFSARLQVSQKSSYVVNLFSKYITALIFEIFLTFLRVCSACSRTEFEVLSRRTFSKVPFIVPRYSTRALAFENFGDKSVNLSRTMTYLDFKP